LDLDLDLDLDLTVPHHNPSPHPRALSLMAWEIRWIQKQDHVQIDALPCIEVMGDLSKPNQQQRTKTTKTNEMPYSVILPNCY